MKFQLIQKLLVCLLIIMIMNACDKIISTPKSVLSKYLTASLSGNYEEAYKFISSNDKQIKSLDEYLEEKSEDDNFFIKFFENEISYKVESLNVSKNKAQAVVSVTTPDYSVMLKEMLGVILLSAFGKKTNEKEIEKKFKEHYMNKDIPMTTSTQTYEMIKDVDGWKIFLDWETEKKEAEKQNKVKGLLLEAEKLKKQNKLYGALENFEKVLELDSEIVEAKQGRDDTQNAIKLFEEKQLYIKHVKLKDFKVGEGSRFGFGDPEPSIFGKIVNSGDKTLNKVEITVYFLGDNGKPISEENFYPIYVSDYGFGDSNKPLKPGYIKDFGYVVGDEVPSEWSGKAKAKITNIEFQH